jgi:hypothetical protein
MRVDLPQEMVFLVLSITVEQPALTLQKSLDSANRLDLRALGDFRIKDLLFPRPAIKDYSIRWRYAELYVR